ncbi:MAG TPA: hypothetical protein DEP46_01180 [Blastocatellia bacterium]|nr:hypothetical protein [Blastocatellia bacterium]
MLTRQQLQRLAQRERIGLQAQERDDLQYLLLSLLYARSQSLIFKGGTALRIVYRGQRYLEDLDFNAPGGLADVQPIWQAVIGDLARYGIEAETREAWEGENGYSFDVSYRGPLYDGRDRTQGKVRVDLNLRDESMEVQRQLVSPEYDDVRPFVITTLTPAHLLAEKVRALLVRGKPRDLYDVWLMQSKGWPVDWVLIGQKLSLYAQPFSPDQLQAALDRIAPDWEGDLRPLLPQLPRFEDARRVADEYLKPG